MSTNKPKTKRERKKKTTHKKNTPSSKKPKKIIQKIKTAKNKDFPSKKRVTIKKSLTVTSTHRPSLNTPFLITALSLCALAIIIILFILFTQFTSKNKLFSPPPKPHHLSTITSEDTFLTIKNSLLQHVATLNNLKEGECLESNFFNTSPQKSVYVYDNLLFILKRGKIFTVNTATNKFINSIEISPNPIKEANAVTYNNIFFNKDTIIVTGYRAETQSLEISTFSTNKSGKLTRAETYNLPSSSCNYASSFINNKFVFYTSRPLSSEITLANIQTLKHWSPKLNGFTVTYPASNQVFYNNNSFLENPTVHSITTCTLQNNALSVCQQRHLIGNLSSKNFLDGDNFYLWTTTTLDKNKVNRTIPNSKIYQFNLSQTNIKMIQTEGIPVSNDCISKHDNQLIAIIRQNNDFPPAWHTKFTKNNIANFKLNLNDFSKKGKFINSPDNYALITPPLRNIDAQKIISIHPVLITFDTVDSIISIYDKSIKTYITGDKILSIKKIPKQKDILIISKQGNSIIAQKLNIETNLIVNQLILQKNATTLPKITWSLFAVKNNTLASIALSEESPGKGILYLLNVSDASLNKLNSVTFDKSYQRITDHCQNDCQQSWQDQVGYFSIGNAENEIIYAIIGSKLRKIRLSDSGNIQILEMIDYTYRPAPSKPRRPRARIPGGAKLVNGKYVCAKKHGYVGKSKKNNKGYLHLDLECCLDPDEYPNPWCTYKPGELSVTKLRYKDYHGNIKIKKH